jgi:hypothetical protein
MTGTDVPLLASRARRGRRWHRKGARACSPTHMAMWWHCTTARCRHRQRLGERGCAQGPRRRGGRKTLGEGGGRSTTTRLAARAAAALPPEVGKKATRSGVHLCENSGESVRTGWRTMRRSWRQGESGNRGVVAEHDDTKRRGGEWRRGRSARQAFLSNGGRESENGEGSGLGQGIWARTVVRATGHRPRRRTTGGHAADAACVCGVRGSGRGVAKA